FSFMKAEVPVAVNTLSQNSRSTGVIDEGKLTEVVINVEVDVSAEDIIGLLKENDLGGNSEYFEMKTRKDVRKSSFKLVIHLEQKDRILSTTLWPSGISVNNLINLSKFFTSRKHNRAPVAETSFNPLKMELVEKPSDVCNRSLNAIDVKEVPTRNSPTCS
ncbi:hypothetical protein HHI36_017753, partial [Cryptolaemus montrouzieri]